MREAKLLEFQPKNKSVADGSEDPKDEGVEQVVDRGIVRCF